MRTIKPQRLGVLLRSFENERKQYLSVGILAYFAFDRPNRLLHEVNMYKALAPMFEEGLVLDECMPKAEQEVLVDGDAFAPGGPATACKVQLTLGKVDKTLYVVGDRRWKRGVATDPEPFERMTVSWARAFGGEGYEKNPRGRGMKEITDPETGATFHPLPNVELPNKLVASPSDRPEPAGLSGYELPWPQRRQYQGTYDKKWEEQRMPGFPEDFDWRFFNVAPPDQRLGEDLTPGAPFRIENMHADKRVLEGTLPTVRARCFMELRAGDELSLREVVMRPETLRLFPNIERGVLIYRGVIEVAEDDARDVEHLIVAAEDLGESRPVSHYRGALDRRLDKEKGYLELLRDRDLLPSSCFDGEPVEDEAIEGMADYESEQVITHNMRRRAQRQLDELRAELEAQGIDPDEKGVPKEIAPFEPAPPLEELPEFVEVQLERAKKERAAAEAQSEAQQAEARRIAEEHGIDIDALIAKGQQEGTGPPAFRAEAELARIRDQKQLAENAGIPLPHIDALLADPDLQRKLVEIEALQLDAYRRYAQHFPAAARLDMEASQALRVTVQAAVDAGESLAGRDLTGADLSGMSLAGVDLTGAFLESAVLVGADLSAAKLDDAVFARADLTDARLTGASLKGANFGEAILLRTDITGGVEATRAVFAKARLTETKLTGAELTGADMLEAVFDGADLSGAKGSGLFFMDCRLDRVRLTGVELTKCVFFQVSGAGADFSGARLDETAFLDADLPDVVFTGAQLSNFRVVGKSNMARGKFLGVAANMSNFRGIDLTGADFSGASLESSDFSECALEGACFYRAVAPSSMWVRANLKNANLTSLNAMLAIMQKANIRGANFQGANLFRVDFARIEGDEATNFDGALMKEIRFVERDQAGGRA
ncbi:MAG: DUF2169 domain-containing protein [Myxococcales bacterium]|nr:DUF2169 domain-containing protein [Myxococcales bacterium]